MTTKQNINGWLIIDKALGDSSAKAVAIVKRFTKAKKVGHAGTLDPLATGVLPIALGEATKTVSYAMDATKRYRFTISFGTATDTDDREGETIETSDIRPTKEQLLAALPDFLGTIDQTPPIYSAIKKAGKRACDLAREGKEVEIPSRKVRIDTLEMTDFAEHGEFATFEVTCGKGTYVRSLGRDIAKKLGTCGHISLLRRLQVGIFSEKNAISLESLKEIVHNADLGESLLPVVAVLDDILAVTVTPEQALELRQGKLISKDLDITNGTVVRIMDDATLVALATYTDGAIKSVRVFNL